MATYKGFSTINLLSQKKFKLTDFELVKQDLFNRLNTRRGERVMLPNEGCIIWELINDPFTATVKNQIKDNLTNIINADPRLVLQNLILKPNEDIGTLIVEINVLYPLTNQVELLSLLFDELGTVSMINSEFL